MQNQQPKRYLHRKAIKALQAEVETVIVIAGRGWAKSTLLGAEAYANIKQMPRSLGALWGLTFNQLETKVLPSMIKEWHTNGLKQDRPGSPGHFVIGRRPPPYFKRPYNMPVRWENVITFFNGAAIELISMDRPDTIAGGSYDYFLFDEAVYTDKEIHDQKAIPSLRGNVQHFYRCPRHGRKMYVSSQAPDPSGYWVEDQKYLRSEEGEMVLDEEQNPILDLNTLFIHGTSWDNEAILTRKTLLMWRRTMRQDIYDLEIMATRSEANGQLFYSEFRPAKHTYIKSYGYDYDYERNPFGLYTAKRDIDRDPELPLRLSLDFGTRFNSCSVAQHHLELNELRFINQFFESSNALIENMIKAVCDFYENHATRVIHLYGDPAGNKLNHMDEQNLYDKVEEYLQSRGWTVVNHMDGRAYPLHRTRHTFINDVLAEKDDTLIKVRINKIRCKYLTTSIRNAPMGKDGKKGKGSERSNQNQETATHLSDTFDYMIFYGFFDQFNSSLVGDASTHGGARFGNRLL